MGSITTIRWDKKTDARLARWVERTGKSVHSLIEEAVRERLDDFDEYEIGRASLDAFKQTNDAAIDVNDVEWPTY